MAVASGIDRMYMGRATIHVGLDHSIGSNCKRMPRHLKLRVAVGDEQGARSPQWVVFTRGNDVYAAHRTMGHVEKISFHESGICRRAFTQTHGTPSTMPDRVMQRWRRAELSPRGSNAATRLLSVSFPTAHLFQSPVRATKRVRAGPAGSMQKCRADADQGVR